MSPHQETHANARRCKFCGGQSLEVVRNTLRYDVKRNVLKCNTCSFVQLEPKANEQERYVQSDNYKNHYGPVPYRPSSCREIFDTYLSFQKDIIKEIESVLSDTKSILDIGCQTGHFLHALKGRIPTRIGLELNADDVAFIRETLDFPVYEKPIETAHITEAPFDLITAIQVLEHIENVDSFLEGIARNLKTGGHLYLEVPNIDDVLVSTFKNKTYEDFFYHEPHLNYFSVKTLGELLAKHGFSGELRTIQRYNVLNHLHWISAHGPQGDFTVGNQTPILAERAPQDKTLLADELNTFIQKADVEYKAILEKHNVGEVIIFLGTRTHTS